MQVTEYYKNLFSSDKRACVLRQKQYVLIWKVLNVFYAEKTTQAVPRWNTVLLSIKEVFL